MNVIRVRGRYTVSGTRPEDRKKLSYAEVNPQFRMNDNFPDIGDNPMKDRNKHLPKPYWCHEHHKYEREC